MTQNARGQDAVGGVEAPFEQHFTQKLAVHRQVDRLPQLPGTLGISGVRGAFLIEIEPVVLHHQ